MISMAVALRPEILLIKQNKTVPTPDPISKTFSPDFAFTAAASKTESKPALKPFFGCNNDNFPPKNKSFVISVS